MDRHTHRNVAQTVKRGRIAQIGVKDIIKWDDHV